jgi:hypothetical protein
MRSFAFFAVVTSAVFVLTAPTAAQEKGGKSQSIIVQLDNTATVLKGRLVSLDADSVTLIVKGHQTSLPLDRVVRITARHRDSVRNGALISAVIGGALCALNCGQGLSSAGERPLAVASSAAVWGLAGAWIDALNRHEEVLYQRAPAP